MVYYDFEDQLQTTSRVIFLSLQHSLGTTGEEKFCLSWKDEQDGYKSPSILSALTTLKGE